MNRRVILSLRNHEKHVPYKPQDRDDSRNYGFIPLKRRPDLIATIPEVQDNVNLRDALVAINRPDTAFFSIGCEKALNSDGDSYLVRGYLEFAFNFVPYAAEAQSYFKLFFDFSRQLFERNGELAVVYHWELEGNRFLDAGPNLGGYSCTVWITTDSCSTDAIAFGVWGEALDVLSEYLGSIRWPVADQPIY